MNIKKITLVHETPSHFILHDGKSHFHVAKSGIDTHMMQKIRSFAEGGEVHDKKNVKNLKKSMDKFLDEEGAEKYAEGGEAKLGTGKRFANLQKSLSKNSDIKDPAALAASIGRKKYGAKKFNKLAHHMDEGGDVESDEEDSTEDPIQEMSEQADSYNEELKRLKNSPLLRHYAGGSGEIGDEKEDSDNKTPQVPVVDPYKLKQLQKGMAKPGLAYGGQVPEPPKPEVDIDHDQYPPMPMQHFDAGTPDAPVGEEEDGVEETPAEEAATPVQSAEGQAPITLDINNPGSPSVVSQGPQIPPNQQVSMNPQAAAPAPQAAPLYDQQGNPRPAENLQEAEKLGQGAIKGLAEQQTDVAAKTAKALDASNKLQEAQQDAYNTHLQKVEGDVERFKQAAESGKIDPNRLWNNTSIGGKISAALGMILGGGASGVTGQANPALSFIQNAIQNDIKAQEMDQSNRMNMYKMGLEEYRSAPAARTAAMLQANTLLGNKLQQISASSQNPVIQARASQAYSELYKASIPLKIQLAQYGLDQEIAQKGSANFNLAQVPQEKRQLAVPVPGGGYTFANSPKDAQELKQVLPIYDEIEDKMHQMQDMQKEDGRKFFPGSPDARKADALRASILDRLSQAKGLKRLTDNEVKLFEKQVPSSADYYSGTAGTQMQMVIDDIRGKRERDYQYKTISGTRAVPHIKTGPPKI